jgi:isoleucyl-tRNA synthetase
MDYRDTLNLPETAFAMKANLAQREPRILQRWEKEGLYQRIQAAAAGRPLFVLHDGPPYANGNIHLGTAFNKVLKDIILRAKRLAGYNAPYIPGWDCHGLPIEHNVDKELGEKKSTIPKLSKRRACREYAKKWIKIQKEQFKRLGVLGDWDDPYLTISFDYEATIAREFNAFLLSGSVVRNRKPVYWCSTCTTALAEAEVEYHNHTSPSIYVKFPVVEDLADIDPALAGEKVFFLIWTTTPWTLPANLAVALHPDFVYAAVAVAGETWIIARELVETVFAALGRSDYRVTATFAAAPFEGRSCRHPFIDRKSLLVLADYVTLDAGTGCVHTAPGHGADDYQTGLRYGLEVLSPVDDEGRFTAEAGAYAGQQIPAVNRPICDDLAATGLLAWQGSVSHSYPHCWRCKKPVLYRATPQWFIAMENNNLREKALQAIAQVEWIPAWGMQRIQALVGGRPDWCLSRQRSWGVPLTVISCRDCGEVVQSEAVVARIDELFRQEGADAWFSHAVEDFLPAGTLCAGCGGSRFGKEEDILDVWFDSGVSHAAVCEQRPELRSPADLYLEGTDQHRGWFQSSLLASTGNRGRAPFKGVLTHGYVVDGQGKKMSKSVGNVVVPAEVIEKFGAEILRLWVASEDYRDDVKVSDEILRQVADAYRKIRNTIRYLLGNLGDFRPEQAVAVAELPELDRWALAKFAELRERVVQAYARYEFHSVYQALNYFCGTTMSAFYLDILKDRLYASGADSPSRRAAQTALATILDGLLRLMSPILPFTADEAWSALHGLSDHDSLEKGIHFVQFPAAVAVDFPAPLQEKWAKLIKIRAEITKALELARQEKVIGHPLEAEVLLQAEGELAGFLRTEWQLLKEISIVSELSELTPATPPRGIRCRGEEIAALEIQVQPAPGEKCLRCWIRSTSVGEEAAHPGLCRRCAEVVATIPELKG